MAWLADELEAFADRRLWPCFRCLELFDPREAKICEECKWMVCPRCRACLCSLSGKEKIVAIAVWLSHEDYLRASDRLRWLKYARKLRDEA